MIVLPPAALIVTVPKVRLTSLAQLIMLVAALVMVMFPLPVQVGELDTVMAAPMLVVPVEASMVPPENVIAPVIVVVVDEAINTPEVTANVPSSRTVWLVESKQPVAWVKEVVT